MRCTYIAIGSNLNNPLQQVKKAMAALSRLPETRLLNASSCYRSKPLGPCDQPDFINAVVAVETTFSPHQLLQQTQCIEQSQGRVRSGQRWGPRVIDLDIVLYESEVIETADLTIPHPGLTEREFVLYPLLELVPDVRLPSGEPLAAWVSRCPLNGLEQLPS